MDDVWEGIGVFIDKHGRRHDAEYKQGKWHGKLTVIYPEGGILNQTFKNGEKQTNTNITDNDDAAFYKNGRPHKAIEILNKSSRNNTREKKTTR